MLPEPLTLGNVLTVRDRVFGRSEDKYQRQADYITTLGTLLGRPWGDPSRADAVRSAAMEEMTNG
jgi:hypothetical protein